MSDKRFDVVIFDMDTREVQSVIGKNLRRDGGTHNAERRLETAFTRINLDKFSAEIVPAGKFPEGSILPECLKSSA